MIRLKRSLMKSVSAPEIINAWLHTISAGWKRLSSSSTSFTVLQVVVRNSPVDTSTLLTPKPDAS